jgi:hypothetical protein
MPTEPTEPAPASPRADTSGLPGRRAVLVAAALGLAAVGVKRLAVPEADDVPPDEAARRKEALLAAVPLRLSAWPAADAEAALAALGLPPDQLAALKEAVDARKLRLAKLEVFDADAEDGDVVRIESIGLVHTVRLRKQVTAVPVFVPADGKLLITAVDEGLGGGVTLGVVSAGVPLKGPPMAVGQKIILPVIVAGP